MVKHLPATQEFRVQAWVGKILWSRNWQPTPVFLPGEFQGQRNLAGYSPWGHKELGTIERLTHTHTIAIREKTMVFAIAIAIQSGAKAAHSSPVSKYKKDIKDFIFIRYHFLYRKIKQ